MTELDRHMIDTCPYPVTGGSENTEGKVNILLQTYISKQMVDNFSLVSDMSYVAQVLLRHTYITQVASPQECHMALMYFFDMSYVTG